ncbi:hypothetical protein V6N12_002663 [Hibiscus sabdariffa]|uniref:CCHC-type domain-containing protein n=1 Tax=Hibiscus sabdariffa TaxID=183260 RepID=A0ABR2ED63_9ROSI
MVVSVNLSKPLVLKVVVNGRTQLVEYEALPTICFVCGTYGHTRDSCPTLIPPSNNPHNSDTGTDQASTMPHQDPFGPWMVVERRQHRSQKKQSNNRPHITGTSLGSRFTPLEVDNDVGGDVSLALTTDQEMSPAAPAPRGPLPVTSRGKEIVPLKFKVNKARSILKHTSGPSVSGSFPALHASLSKQAPCVTPPLDRSKHSAITLSKDTAPVRHSDTRASNLPPTVPPSAVIVQLHTRPREPPDPSITAPHAAPSNTSIPVMVEDSSGVSHLVEDVVPDMQQ